MRRRRFAWIGAFYRVARYRDDNQDERVKLVIFDDWREKSSYYSSVFFFNSNRLENDRSNIVDKLTHLSTIRKFFNFSN